MLFTPTGKVTVKVGKATKTATLKNGVATVKVKVPKKTKPGKLSVTATYSGDGNTLSGTAKAKVKVTK